MVSTWNPGNACPSPKATRPPNVSATSGDGIFCVSFGQSTNTARVSAPISTSCQRALGSARPSATTRSGVCSGIFATVKPRKSLSWSKAMTTAMPAVKPLTTG